MVSGEKYLSKYNPTGDPMPIPINSLNTKFQSILFQTYGIIKILIKTSNISMIGTISIAGIIKEKPEIHVAEKPKPLKPLIIDAINTVNKTKETSIKLNWKKDRIFMYFF